MFFTESDTGHKLTRVRGRSAQNAELSWKRRAYSWIIYGISAAIPSVLIQMLVCLCFVVAGGAVLVPIQNISGPVDI